MGFVRVFGVRTWGVSQIVQQSQVVVQLVEGVMAAYRLEFVAFEEENLALGAGQSRESHLSEILVCFRAEE